MGEKERSFKRAILKLSGEALREPGSTDNISPEIVGRIASEICAALESGVELGISGGALPQANVVWIVRLLTMLGC